MGTVITTFSGAKVDYLKPDPKSIDLDDIALGLSQMPRYAGQTDRPYSVAQHCLFVAELAPQCRSHALIHDAQEALLCDLPTPAKEALRALGSTAYDELESRLYRAICLRLGMEPQKLVTIRLVDIKARDIEMPMLGRGKPKHCEALAKILTLPDGGRWEWLRAVKLAESQWAAVSAIRKD